jgi:hypothetical protein
MIGNPMDMPLVSLSVKVYRLLLVAYPVKFKQEYGPHMLQVFGDYCTHVFHQNGVKGMIRLWAVTLFDLFQSLIEEHLQKETFMTKSKFIRLGGWSLILGAVTLFLFILAAHMESNFYDPFRRLQVFYDAGLVLFIWFTPALLGVGMLGLRARYGEQTGNLGKNILLLGVVAGPIITLLGVVGSEALVVEWAWILLYAGNATLLAFLTTWGILALQTKPLPRWNGLPIIAGLWYPVLLSSALIAEANGVPWDLIQNIATITIPLQCIALFVLGYILQADAPQEAVLA